VLDFDNDGVAAFTVDLNGDDEIFSSPEAEFVNHLYQATLIVLEGIGSIYKPSKPRY
jgi:hypothetical protein